MVNFSICPFSGVIWYITFIPSISKHTLLFTINYYNCLFVKSLTRTFWFVWFFLIFQLHLHKLPYLEMCTDHINHTSTLSITVHIVSIIFPDFEAIFTFITTFRNVHSLHQHYPKTVNSILDHVYSFFLIFHDFTAIFISITIFGKVHRPCKQYPNIVTNSHDQHHPPNNPLHGPWQTKSSGSCFP